MIFLLIRVLVVVYERLDVHVVDEHFPSDLNEGKLAVPDLAPPEPFGSADFSRQFLDRVEPFLGHSLF
jgi:hypothetical protein